MDLDEKILEVSHNLEFLKQIQQAFKSEKESIDTQAKSMKEIGALLDRAKNA